QGFLRFRYEFLKEFVHSHAPYMRALPWRCVVKRVLRAMKKGAAFLTRRPRYGYHRERKNYFFSLFSTASAAASPASRVAAALFSRASAAFSAAFSAVPERLSAIDSIFAAWLSSASA